MAADPILVARGELLIDRELLAEIEQRKSLADLNLLIIATGHLLDALESEWGPEDEEEDD